MFKKVFINIFSVYVITICFTYTHQTNTDFNIDLFDDNEVNDANFPTELDYSGETSLIPPVPPLPPLAKPAMSPIIPMIPMIPTSGPVVKAVVVLRGNGITHGLIHLVQLSGGPTQISGTIIGLRPLGSFGFHFHERPVAGHCESAGEHFNPTGQNHGGPNDLSAHVGDLGNVDSNLKGISQVHIIDQKVSLIGKLSVIGRSLVVHSNTDDLGTGIDRESRISGNSGGRLACGTVRFVKIVKG